MLVDIDVLVQLAFGTVALYLVWDRQKLVERVEHLEEMHNKLCGSVEYFSAMVEDELESLDKRIKD